MKRRTQLCTVFIIALAITPALAQDRPPILPTIANVGLRTYDTVNTCRLLQRPGWREYILPAQHCTGIAAISAGFAGGAWTLDYLLRKHKHPRLAQFQWVSAAGAGSGIMLSIRWSR